ncbi:hypothetical protein LshimejAT787_1201300 [Lyophyllum shimeji]|uniref:Uncharacterized protein n=1 Tax=Lyophyllum shimeji TaxID=47721 RepID=A0A9P3PW06_LYOSH|nr:hypothetical protein LshimejAT787_1201300 [Lyophyllum shimeji]
MFNPRVATFAFLLVLWWTTLSAAINVPGAVQALARGQANDALVPRTISGSWQPSLFARQNATCTASQVSTPCDGISICCPAGNICRRDDTGALKCLSVATVTSTSVIIPSFTHADTTTTEVILSTLSIPSYLTMSGLSLTNARLSGPPAPTPTGVFGFPDSAVAVGVSSTLVICTSFVIILLAQ